MTIRALKGQGNGLDQCGHVGGEANNAELGGCIIYSPKSFLKKYVPGFFFLFFFNKFVGIGFSVNCVIYRLKANI